MKFAKLYISVNKKFEAVKFLQDRFLLFKTRNCSHCIAEMTLYLGEKEDRFRCNNRNCIKGPQKQLKAGSWIEGSHLDYSTIILFIYCWSQEYTTIAFVQKELEIGSVETIVD